MQKSSVHTWEVAAHDAATKLLVKPVGGGAASVGDHAPRAVAAGERVLDDLFQFDALEALGALFCVCGGHFVVVVVIVFVEKRMCDREPEEKEKWEEG